ncbi:MAG: hypothetical protein IK002_09655 [Treponema sp.]|uniref:DUF6056 family protein n=1 Tax=Treponema sp. TaxID=166 RepID=UPI00298ED076|nr:DUF6056 family protein [Treponema sp.]MBR5934239.1 hypothetical protein [Treponema sp.]
MEKSLKQKNVYMTAILLFLFTYFFLVVLNAVFHVQSDDLGKPLRGLQSAVNQYMHWNGRLGELISVTYGSWFASTPFFPFVNSLIGSCVIFFIYVHIFGRLPDNTSRDITFFSILFLFLLFDPVYIFGSLFYWSAACYNYLYAWFLILLLLLPVNFFWRKKEFSTKTSRIFLILGIPIGIFAGWASEFCIVIILLWIASIIIAFIKKQKLPLWYFTSLIALVVGWLILYLCPGLRERGLTTEDFYSISALLKAGPEFLFKRLLYTYDRLTYMSHSSLYYENFIFVSLFLILTSIFYKPSVKKFLVTFAVVAVLFCMVRFIPKMFFIIGLIGLCILSTAQMRKEDKYISTLWLIIAAVLVTEFIFIGSTIQIGIPRRARMQFAILNMILISVIMSYCFEVFKDDEKVKRTVKILSVTVTLLFSAFVVGECIHMRMKWNAMEKSVAEQKSKGIMDVTVSKDYFKSLYWSYGDWGDPNEDPLTWPNNKYANYYGVNTYTVK